MALHSPIKPAKKPRIGLYSVGLRAYWEQFPGLRERLIALWPVYRAAVVGLGRGG